MPSNVREMGVSNAYDTMQNLSATVRLVRGHLEQYQSKYDSLVLSLAAYNAGPGAVRKYGGVPPYRETRNYVKKVLNLYRQFCGQ
jgi:soluble lytic murein transglycosylase-like protein